MKKIIDRKEFGSLSLGCAVVKLIEYTDTREQRFEIAVSNGTSYKYKTTPDAAYAKVLFKETCEDVEKEFGEFRP